MQLTKEACLELGKAYIQKHNKYPVSKHWTITTAGTSRDRIYENWSSWLDFISDLQKVCEVPLTTRELKEKIVKPIKTKAMTITKIKSTPLYTNKPKSYSLADLIANYFTDNNFKVGNDLIDAIANKKGITDNIVLYDLTISELSVMFINKPKQQAFYVYILRCYNKKLCSGCKSVYDLEFFNKASRRADGLQSTCKFCNSNYIKNDFARYRDLAAQKRFLGNMAISKKYNTELVELYAKCPKGHHVDHIVPINGDNVCGLHVPWNLQYLTIQDNLSKSNKFE